MCNEGSDNPNKQRRIVLVLEQICKHGTIPELVRCGWENVGPLLLLGLSFVLYYALETWEFGVTPA